MHPYILSLGFASLISAACGGAVFLHQHRHRGNQLAGLLLLGCSYWSLMELLANLAPNAETATGLLRLSSVGPNMFGPLLLHIFLEATGYDSPRLRTVRNGLYAAAAVLIGLALSTDLMLSGAVKSPWGYQLEAGPLFSLTYVLALAGVTTGLMTGYGAVNRLSAGERAQLPWVLIGAAVPLTLSAVTDLLLPILDIQFPALGSISLACVALLVVWIDVHFGYSLLTPGSFATEILETLPDGVALLRPDDRIRSTNQGLSQLAGRSSENLENLPIGEILSWSFDTEEFDEVDCDLVNADGAHIPVAVSVSNLHDRQGNDLGRVLVVRDLREVADLRRRLVTSARLAAVGELAAGIAHEINNPLAFVRSNLSQLETLWLELRKELSSDTTPPKTKLAINDVDDLIEESLEGVDRAAEIIRGVKSFSHAGTGKRELANLNTLLDDVLRVATPQLRQRIQIERDYAELPDIECAAQPLRQVFMNLVLNASQALESNGTIQLRSRPVDGGVSVEISDDGRGIAPEIIDRIFDPFFTTKGVGEGTGLGLGIAYQIVQQHRGTITVASALGEGTQFRVTLPTSDSGN